MKRIILSLVRDHRGIRGSFFFDFDDARLTFSCRRSPYKSDTLTIYNWIVDNHSMGKPSDLVQGTLDLLILKTLSLEPKHGWAIAKRIQQISNEVLQVQQGSLYPALHRLEQQGWIRARWSESGTGRQAKFYSLTAAGRARLEKEKESWKRLSTAIDLVIDTI
jgi:PadR family transcriptional regulator, regulatory protein PadR